jgi:hypothetical protein
MGRISRQRLIRGLRDLREWIRPTGVEAQYRRVYDRLTRTELSREEEALSERDLASLLGPPEGRVDHFLGLYSAEGGRMALERYLADLPLRDASSAIAMGRVREVDGDTLQWQGRPQVLGITLPIQAYFERDQYRSTVERIRESTKFLVAVS